MREVREASRCRAEFVGGRTWPPFLLHFLDCSSCDLDKQAVGGGQNIFVGVRDDGFGPVLATLARRYAALETQRLAAGHGAEKFYFHLRGHRGVTQRAHGFAHCFVEKRGDDAAVQEAGVAFEGFRNFRQAHDGAVLGNEKFELQPGGVGGAASEACVLGGVGQGFQGLVYVKLHALRIAKQRVSKSAG